MLRDEPGARTRAAAATATWALLPASAAAHSFGRSYDLPVPFWLYGFGAGAALILSFVLVGAFVASPPRTPEARSRPIGQQPWVRALRRARAIPLLRAIALGGLALCLLTGFLGTPNPYRNFNMTFFWVVFGFGFAYLTALVGDLYAAINPWRTLAQALDRVFPGFARGRVRYPAALASWPAVAFYMVFIWIELFGGARPAALAWNLLADTGLNLAGVWLVGSGAWFRHCEFFGVFLRLLASLSPLDYRPDEPAGSAGRLRWRPPFSGVLEQRAESLSLVVFILFMLSSTAFDGLHSTLLWMQTALFWFRQLWRASGVATDWLGREPIDLPYEPLFQVYETLALLASPFLYLGVYLLFVWLAQRAARSERSVRGLALAFAHTLLPIALVYHVTHYFTLILAQGPMLVGLVSDPFGWGWNLFGSVGLVQEPILPDMGLVWHGQVALILLGHVVSVHLAHAVALRIFPTRREALLSQLPMLALMVLFTVAGLWILALPMRSGSV